MINENELKEAIERISNTQGVKGYIYAYLDNDKFKGNITISLVALAPFIMEWLTKKK